MATGILKDLADGAKRLGEIKKEISDLEFNERILELRQLLLSAQTEILTLREEKLELKTDIAALQEKEDLTGMLIEVEGFKYDAKDGQPSGLPYCPTCDVKDGALFRLSRKNEQFSKCPNCGIQHNAARDGRVNMDNPPIKMPRMNTDWDNY